MLKAVLIANAASCALFGVIFILNAPSVAGFLGSPPVWLLYIVGAGLSVNAVLLVIEAKRTEPDPKSVRGFAVGDGIWVFVSIGLVVSGTWVTNPPGVACALGIAAFVGLCGLLQFTLTAKQPSE